MKKTSCKGKHVEKRKDGEWVEISCKYKVMENGFCKHHLLLNKTAKNFNKNINNLLK